MNTKFDLKDLLERSGCTKIIEWGAHIAFMRNEKHYMLYMWQIPYIVNASSLIMASEIRSNSWDKKEETVGFIERDKCFCK